MERAQDGAREGPEGASQLPPGGGTCGRESRRSPLREALAPSCSEGGSQVPRAVHPRGGGALGCFPRATSGEQPGKDTEAQPFWMDVERPDRTSPARIPAASQSFRPETQASLSPAQCRLGLAGRPAAQRLLFSSRPSACFWRTKPAAQTQHQAVTWTPTRLLLAQVRLPPGAVEWDGVCPRRAVYTRVPAPAPSFSLWLAGGEGGGDEEAQPLRGVWAPDGYPSCAPIQRHGGLGRRHLDRVV